MVVKKLRIKKYGWDLLLYLAVSCYHTDDILSSLSDIECPDDIYHRVKENLLKNDMNTGFTFSNKEMRSTVMVVGLFSSPAEFLNSLSHEMRHMVDDIGNTFELSPGGEDIAYLTGEVNGMLINEYQRFICDCGCHH